MKITEQTLHELLVEPHTIKELITTGRYTYLYETKSNPELAEAIAFHRHVEHCPACSNHIKCMCDEGRQLLNEWAISFTDSRVN